MADLADKFPVDAADVLGMSSVGPKPTLDQIEDARRRSIGVAERRLQDSVSRTHRNFTSASDAINASAKKIRDYWYPPEPKKETPPPVDDGDEVAFRSSYDYRRRYLIQVHNMPAATARRLSCALAFCSTLYSRPEDADIRGILDGAAKAIASPENSLSENFTLPNPIVTWRRLHPGDGKSGKTVQPDTSGTNPWAAHGDAMNFIVLNERKVVMSMDKLEKISKIVNAFIDERKYQDQKWGMEHRSVPAWLLTLDKKIRDAKTAWACNSGDEAALAEIMQVGAVAFAVMEQNGVFTVAHHQIKKE